MINEIYRPELAYVYGGETTSLRGFVEGFLGVIGGSSEQQFRTAKVITKYEEYVRSGGGSGDIREKMNGSPRIFIENIFPYDAIMPMGANLLHLCLFSSNGNLSEREINQMIEEQYPDRAAFIFVHGALDRTVRDIWHAHVVLDLG